MINQRPHKIQVNLTIPQEGKRISFDHNTDTPLLNALENKFLDIQHFQAMSQGEKKEYMQSLKTTLREFLPGVML